MVIKVGGDMRRRANRLAPMVALIPGIMIPVMFIMERAKFPDLVIGGWIGLNIGAMLLILALAVWDHRQCSRKTKS